KPKIFFKAGNVFFLESPRGVGFSYSSSDAAVPSDAPYNDTYTAENNVLAIKAFFVRYPEYQNRSFYITGESYGGVYIPTLTDALIKAIKSDPTIKYINFKGIAIGNGEMSELLQISSAVNLLYYRGTYDYETFMKISACCPGNTSQIPGYLTPCDFTQYITLDQYGNAHGIQSDNATIYNCGQMVEKYGFEYVWETLNDVYNTYQDCYNPPYNNTGLKKEVVKRRSKRSADISSKPGQLLANKFNFVDMAKLLNKDSTDAFRGVYCYQDDASVAYLRRQDVREALHVNIPGLPEWKDCNNDINENYHQLHHDTTPVFDSILASNWPLRMLIYNGDADMACQFKGDEWFIERLAYNYEMMPVQARKPWYYKYVDNTGFNWDPRVAGFQKKFRGRYVHIDLLTVKGGGHLVPLDRPAPTLQMIYNFINNIDYNTALPYSLIKPVDPFPNATVAPIPYNNETYRQAAKVYDLPGLTFNPTFASHSGYLNGSKQGSYIHYWFVESQNNPSQDPVVFWFTGDIGCSSIAGMLSEMGPFRPNPDGQTLYENVFSWNKQASMIFLEVPRGVGFSYQDWGDDQDATFPDDQNAADAVSAIINWLTIYSSFASRDIYIGGENYGGVLVPLVAKSIGVKIDSGMQPLNSINFRGILIGNGRLSNKWNLAHRGDFMYFHGQLSKEEWTTYRGCCQPQGETYCNITSYLLPNGNSNGNNAICGRIAERIAQQRMHRSSLHLYNMYQDCYGFPAESFGHVDFHVSENNKFFKNHRFNAKAAFVSQFSRMNFKSTDSNGGFQCYMVDAVTKYLNQRSVRDALHVPDYVHQFDYCNDSITYLYTPTYDNDYVHDMTDTFVALFNSNFIKNGDKTNPFRVMLYNGDVDLDVTILEAEYFAETLASNLGAEKKLNRTNWNYQRPGPNSRFRVGGYTKNWYFRNQNVHLDLVTVKGAGTFVAVDRPGPALQMFSNFINNKEQGSPISVSLQRQQLKSQYQPPEEQVTIPTVPTVSLPTIPTPTGTTTTNTASTTAFTGTTTTYTGPTTTGPTPPPPTTTPYTGPSTSASTPPTVTQPTVPTVPTTTTTTTTTTTPASSPTTTTTGGASAASLSLLTIFVSIFYHYF
uniref:Carboxypeptidase n=1 Tax=Panagrolaimus sp. PS1159 TaxID=55785 RepID=A0AC35FXG8_9BILA